MNFNSAADKHDANPCSLAARFVLLVFCAGVLSGKAWAQDSARNHALLEEAGARLRDVLITYVWVATDELAKLDPSDPETHAFLMRALRTGNTNARIGAMQALVHDEESITIITKYLEDRDEAVRMSAAAILKGKGVEARASAPDLARVLGRKGEHRYTRLLCAQALAKMGAEPVVARDALMEFLRDDAYSLREIAADALSDMGVEAAPAEELLGKTLRDGVSTVRKAAVEALKAIGPAASVAAPDLAIALRDQNAKVRQSSFHALKKLGPHAKTAVPALVAALSDQRAIVRGEAALVLASIGADEAVNPLVKVMRTDNDPEVRMSAVLALQLVRAKASVVPLMEKTLADPDPKVRFEAAKFLVDSGKETEPLPSIIANGLELNGFRKSAAQALTTLGPAAVAAVPRLVHVLSHENEQDPSVRAAAAQALGSIGASSAVLPLIDALKDGEQIVRQQAAQALGNIGAESLQALQVFQKALREDHAVGLKAIGQSGHLLWQLQVHLDRLSVEQLAMIAAYFDKVHEVLKTNPPLQTAWTQGLAGVEGAYRAKLAAREGSVASRLVAWAREDTLNMLVTGIVLYTVAMLTICLLVLLLRPLWFVRIGDKLRPYALFTFPDGVLAGTSVDLRLPLLVRLFEHHPRVLDAWVSANAAPAREAFENKNTVAHRKVHVDLPVVLDGQAVTGLAGEHLRRAFAKRRGCVLIVGEGGSGKTSLACHIAKLALSDDKDLRPSKHLMLPVLIEQELNLDTAAQRPLIEAIRGQLQALIGVAEPISEQLLDQLLRNRRILVIVDHFSEMTEATRKHVRPGGAEFPVNALVVTSRIEEELDNVPRTVIKPLRVEGNRLSSFMEAYLARCGKRDLFDDAEYFDLCRRLSLVVNERNITVLLARLYADQVVALKRRQVTSGQLPENVPDLMLSYLNQLNRDVTDERLDERTIHRDAKTVAWQCLREGYRPQAANQDAVIAAMGGNAAAERLKYLEKRLHIIESISPAKDQVRYTLDPLAEYLAGLHLIDTCRDDVQSWREFLSDARQIIEESSSIKGFLAAVRDTCRIKGAERRVPQFVEQELAILV